MANFKLGRNRPIAVGPHMKLRNYLLRALPPPPATMDYSAAAQASLRNIYGNDTLGDCVIAGIAHVVGTMTGNAGSCFTYTSDQIIALYGAIGGYNPDDPSTDQGCDEVTALNYWQQNGAPAGAHQIAGWLAVNPADPVEVRTACWLFENLYFGVELPNGWVNPFPSGDGFIWDVADDPNPSQGHCFIAFGYGASGPSIDTWALQGTITDAAVAKYCAGAAGGALYTVVSKDSIIAASAKAPSGFDWSQLVADFDSLGGTVTA